MNPFSKAGVSKVYSNKVHNIIAQNDLIRNKLSFELHQSLPNSKWVVVKFLKNENYKFRFFIHSTKLEVGGSDCLPMIVIKSDGKTHEEVALLRFAEWIKCLTNEESVPDVWGSS